MENNESAPISFRYLLWTFLKIGATSFGGFMALVAVVQKQLVEIDKKLKEEDLLDAVSLASILPGPVAVNVIAYVGYKLKGWRGSMIAFFAILLPSFLLVIGLSYLYFRYGDIPAVKNLFGGILPAVTAIILSVAIEMARKNMKSWQPIAIGSAAALLLIWLGGFETTLLVIAGSGLLGGIFFYTKTTAALSSANESQKPFGIKQITGLSVILLLLLLLLLFGGGHAAGVPKGVQIVSVFSGLSLTLFGGGYVVIPTLYELFVESLHWLTAAEFADGIAIGQVTPGPIFITATFIGYKVWGIWGALLATLAFFTPPALLIVTLSRFVAHIKNSPRVKAVLKGIRPAVIGMIFASVVTIGQTLQFNIATAIIFSATLFFSIKYQISPIYLICAAGVLGIIL